MSAISRTEASQAIARGLAVEGRGRASGGASTPASAAAPSPAGPAPFDFEEDLARRVAEIGAGEIDRRQRVVRAFLESCVARTFGQAAARDPAFGHVVEQAREAMEADPALAAAMARIVDRFSNAP